MANILKVTTPTTGYDNAANVRANPEMQNPVHVQGPVDPNKVVRPDARSDALGQQEGEPLQFKFESNFDNFIRQLQKMPSVAEELPKLLAELSSTSVQSGLKGGIAQEIAKFLGMIEAGQGNLQGLLQNQGMSAVRYTGAFFGLLRKMMNETKSVELKTNILNFLKKYTDMAESGSIMEDIQRDLKEVLQRMFPRQREEAAQMGQRLISREGASPEQQAENLRTLKSDILPYLNEYISKTHDRGVLRDTVAHMADLMGRYENGQQQGVLQAFQKLMDYQAFQRIFGDFDLTKIFHILKNTEFEKASARNKQMDQLAQIIVKGAAGEAGTENVQAFRQLMEAMVLNESVYMPLLHLLVPASVDGTMMFSEMWVDPDAEGGQEKEDGSRERMIKGLVKFDIQDLGFFDLFFLCGEEKVSVQINIPAALEKDSGKIQADIRRILEEHSLRPEEVLTGNSSASIPLTEAFTKLKERKNSINVSI